MPDNIENSPKSIPGSVQSVTLADANLLSDISPWDLRYHQIDKGRLRVDVAMMAGTCLNVLDFKSNLGLHQLGSAPQGAVTLGIPIAGALPTWGHKDVSSGTLLSFGSGVEFDGVSRGYFHGLTFSLPETRFNVLCDKLGFANLETIRHFGLLTTNEPTLNRKLLSKFVLKMLSGDGPELTPQAEDEISSELLASMTDGDPRHADKSSPASRNKARKRAIEVMHHLAPSAARISEICAEAGVGWRTLDRAFLEHFGFGPKSYFKILRLSRVRNEIASHGPQMSVIDAATRWGFSHMSQFSKDYRELFHELPSETQTRWKRGVH